MSTLTSLVKSGKRKIIKTKADQPSTERKGAAIKAQQKPQGTSNSGGSTRSVLGRPDEGISLDVTRPQQGTLNGVLGRPDEGISPDVTRPQQGTLNGVLGRPDEGISPDVTRPQQDARTGV